MWMAVQEENAKSKEKNKNDAVPMDEQRTASLIEQQKQMIDLMAEQQRIHREKLEELMNKWETKSFVYHSNMDTNGIVYALGTEWNQTEWQNPATSGKVVVQCSGAKNDSEPMTAICGREAVRCLTDSIEDAWISLDFGDLRICPSYYTLRHYTRDNEALRSWNLQGSINGYVL